VRYAWRREGERDRLGDLDRLESDSEGGTMKNQEKPKKEKGKKKGKRNENHNRTC